MPIILFYLSSRPTAVLVFLSAGRSTALNRRSMSFESSRSSEHTYIRQEFMKELPLLRVSYHTVSYPGLLLVAVVVIVVVVAVVVVVVSSHERSKTCPTCLVAYSLSVHTALTQHLTRLIPAVNHATVPKTWLKQVGLGLGQG